MHTNAERKIGALLMMGVVMAAEKAPQWPQFRGPGGAGIAEGGAPVQFGSALWKTDAPPGHSSPSIWGDRIFLTAGDRETKKLEVLCLHRKTGKLLWRRQVIATTIERLHDINSPATATPAVDGERVYAYFGSYGLLCFDLDGNPQWTLPMAAATKHFGSGTSPIVAGDAVILSRDDNPEGYLLAFDRRTGKTLWRQPYDLDTVGGTADTSTPVVWENDIIVHRGLEVAAFDVKTGSKKWWVSVRSSGTGSPVVGAEAVYVGTWFTNGEPDLRVPIPDFATLLKRYDTNHDGALTLEEFPEEIQVAQRIEVAVPGANNTLPGKRAFGALDQNKDGKIDKAEWDVFLTRWTSMGDHGLLAIKPGGSGDVTATNILWRENRSVPEIPAPLYSNHRVYTVTNGGIVSCMEAATGKLLYRNRLGVGGSYYASPVLAAGNIYFTSGDGVVSVIRDSEKFELAAKNDLGEPVFATPAIVDGIVYVRTISHLFAFGR